MPNNPAKKGKKKKKGSPKLKVETEKTPQGRPVAKVSFMDKVKQNKETIGEAAIVLNPLIGPGYAVYKGLRWLMSRGGGSSSSTKQGSSSPDAQQIKTLLEFAEKQAKWDYQKDKKRIHATATIIQALDTNNEVGSDKKVDKEINEVTSRCYMYVKIALHAARILDQRTCKPGGDTNARTAGALLSNNGWENVTELRRKDPFLAMPGEVVVYEQITSTSQDRKNAKKYDDALKKWEDDGKIGDPPQKPDKYDSWKDPKLKPGHVEIRGYHGFYSDCRININPSVRSNCYKVIGVYRKITDPMAEKYQNAMLKAIRLKESDDHWDRLYRETGMKTFPTFSDFSKHPWLDVKNDEKKNTVAGAYQTSIKTYNGFRSDDGVDNYFPIQSKGFDPASQTHFAIRIMQQCRSDDRNEDALGCIRKGEIEKAVKEMGLYKQWSCLPGGQDPKYTMSELLQFIQQHLND